MNDDYDDDDSVFNEDALNEYVAGIYVLLGHRMALTYTMNAIIKSIAGTEGIEFLGTVLSAVTYVTGVQYREDNDLPEDEEIYVQVMLDCWEETEDDYPEFYSQSLQFINSSLNADGLAIAAIWENLLTPESPIERDTKLLTRILGDLQHLRDHVSGGEPDHP